MPRRPTLFVLAVVLSACAASKGPGPQEATFPPGERVTHEGPVALELTRARYDLREVSVHVKVSNGGTTPITIEREGVLLHYGELEYPVTATEASPLEAQTVVPPEGHVELRLAFVTEQAMVEAATLQLLSIRRGEAWEQPLRLVIPPPLAFVQAAAGESEDR